MHSASAPRIGCLQQPPNVVPAVGNLPERGAGRLGSNLCASRGQRKNPKRLLCNVGLLAGQSLERCPMKSEPSKRVGRYFPPYTGGSSRWEILPAALSDRHQHIEAAVEVQELDGLKQIADKYKVWLLDQFGVLHDGRKAYPGAIDAVNQLAESGAQLLIISNSSKRASVTISKLGPLGFDPACFVGAITSGELTHKYLKERSDPFFSGLGHRCVHFTWSSRQAVSTHGLGLTVVSDPQDADFILAHGSEAIGEPGPRAGGENDLDPPATAAPLAEMETVMQRAAEKGIPMIVANPDEVTVDGRDLAIMPGTLGKMYERMGGHVRCMGKPDPVIYRAAKDMLGADLESVVAVGDSLHHDIGGAAAAGIDSVFVAGGIHAPQLGIDVFGEKPEVARLRELLIEKNARTPNYCVPLFNW